MIFELLKRIAARLPPRWVAELKRWHFGRQISRNLFNTSEAEYSLLTELVSQDDWVIDVGANVGQYTKRLSDLVGPLGRVIAFEPVAATFALLAGNVERFEFANVTLINAAAASGTGVVGMSIPRFQTGLDNFYEAHITSDPNVDVRALALAIDALAIDKKVSLVKIDAEGHESSVLLGMRRLLDMYRPVLIIETWSEQVIAELQQMGYCVDRAPESSNVVCRPKVNIDAAVGGDVPVAFQ